MKELMKKLSSVLEMGGTKKDIVQLVISGIALVCSLCGVPLPFDPAWAAIILCGVPIVLEAIIGLVTEFDIKADVLVSIALIASVCIGEDFAAGEIAFIMQIGGLLEELTVAKAREGIEKLVHLTPRTARRINSSEEAVIPAEEVLAGDILRVLPGETIPVDGVIISGSTSVNQAIMTGESMPVDKTVGDDVLSGTVNRFGAFDMKATKVGEDSSVQRMIRLVQSADAGKAKIVSLADRWATWIVVTALTAAALTWIISGEIIRAVTILVVFCPCALVLATPTAIMAAIGNAAKHGFLVKEGDALERLAAVDIAAFDKTGTLTAGAPKVIKTECFGADEAQVLMLAAAAEKKSEHPLGKAVVSCYNRTYPQPLPDADSFDMKIGRGVTAEIGGKRILAGNEKLLCENGILLPESIGMAAEKYIDKGCTVIFVADEKIIGFLVLSDTLRSDSPDTLAQIADIGITPAVLTGDNEKAARNIAEQLGISHVKANCMPEDKLGYIKQMQSEKHSVCMIGDGVNDAPALKAANVGIAMGDTGSDIAVDAADIAIAEDDIRQLPHLIALSKRMMRTIKCNLTFSMGLNFAAIILAITGLLGPVAGALVHNAGSVLVIINSAFLLKWKYKKVN